MERPALVPAAILAAGIGVLGYALVAQYGLGVEPCVLCLWQRVPWAATAALAAVALVAGWRGRRLALAVAVCGVLYLIGGGIALYHVGVEQHWWASAAGCGGTAPAAISIEQLRAALTAAAPKACDVVDWTLFGLSMATYNAVVSPLMGAAALVAARALGRAP